MAAAPSQIAAKDWEAWLDACPAAKDAVLALVGALAAAGPASMLHSLLDGAVVWLDTLLPFQPLCGVAQVQDLQQWLAAAIPDLQLTVTELAAAEDQHALVYYRAAGHHTGALRASLAQAAAPGQRAAADLLPPTGRPVQWSGSLVVRLQQQQQQQQQDGPAQPAAAPHATGAGPAWRIGAVWHAWDPLFLCEQAGAAPKGVPAAPAAEGQPGDGGQEQAAEGRPGAAGERTPPSCEERKGVVRQYFEVYNSGDLARLPAIVDPAYHYHGLIDLGGRRGVAGMAGMMGGWRAALGEFAIANDGLLCAAGGRVVFRWRLEGVHTKGPLRGVPAPSSAETTRRIRSCGVTALSIRRSPQGGDDQQCRIWRKVSHANGADLLRQLGVFDFEVRLK